MEQRCQFCLLSDTEVLVKTWTSGEAVLTWLLWLLCSGHHYEDDKSPLILQWIMASQYKFDDSCHRETRFFQIIPGNGIIISCMFPAGWLIKLKSLQSICGWIQTPFCVFCGGRIKWRPFAHLFLKCLTAKYLEKSLLTWSWHFRAYLLLFATLKEYKTNLVSYRNVIALWHTLGCYEASY